MESEETFIWCSLDFTLLYHWFFFFFCETENNSLNFLIFIFWCKIFFELYYKLQPYRSLRSNISHYKIYSSVLTRKLGPYEKFDLIVNSFLRTVNNTYSFLVLGQSNTFLILFFIKIWFLFNYFKSIFQQKIYIYIYIYIYN